MYYFWCISCRQYDSWLSLLSQARVCVCVFIVMYYYIAKISHKTFSLLYSTHKHAIARLPAAINYGKRRKKICVIPNNYVMRSHVCVCVCVMFIFDSTILNEQTNWKLTVIWREHNYKAWAIVRKKRNIKRVKYQIVIIYENKLDLNFYFYYY